MALLARIFLPAASPAEAHAQDHFLQAALTTFAPRAQHPPKPYWKEPDWYEHSFELAPADLATFNAIVALSGGAWNVSPTDEYSSECDAVWNPSPGQIFLLPGVTWAHILLYLPNPPAPEQQYLPQ
jgi:hypothetical protein